MIILNVKENNHLLQYIFHVKLKAFCLGGYLEKGNIK